MSVQEQDQVEQLEAQKFEEDIQNYFQSPDSQRSKELVIPSEKKRTSEKRPMLNMITPEVPNRRRNSNNQDL